MEIAHSLIQACAKQERTAQKELYLKLLPYLRAVANRYLKDTSFTKDVLQESFVKIFKHIHQYDPDKAPLKNWAARIVINISINYNERVVDELTEELIVDIHETLETQPVEQLSDGFLLTLLKKMPKGYFEIFNLFVIDGYNHKEISSILGISEALSRKKLSRARSWINKTYSLSSSNMKK